MEKYRDIGNLGESIFCKWCHEVGLVPNKSDIDRTGWDFIVEFPQSDPRESDKLHESPFEARIQVKSTDSNIASIQISLSNMKRLCTSLTPAFLLVLQFDGGNEVQRAFLVHIGNEIVSKTLKRVQLSNQKLDSKPLNKQKVSVSWDENSRLNLLGGAALWSNIQDQIGGDYSKYVERKAAHLKTVGYESGYAELTGTLVGEESIEALLNSIVGVVNPNIAIRDIAGYKTRFGVKEVSPFIKQKVGSISVSKPVPSFEGRLSINDSQSIKSVTLDCLVYSGSMNEVFPKELRRFRVESGPLEFLFFPYAGKSKFTIHFEEGKEIRLSESLKIIEVCDLLGDPNKALFCELRIKNKPPLKFRIKGDEKQSAPNGISTALFDIRYLLKECGIIEDPYVDFSSLLENRETYRKLCNILESPIGNLRVSCELKDSKSFGNARECLFVRGVGVRVGNKKLLFQLVFRGLCGPCEDGRAEMIPTKIMVDCAQLYDLEESHSDFESRSVEMLEATHPKVDILLLHD